MNDADLSAEIVKVRARLAADGQWPASSNELMTLLVESLKPDPDDVKRDLIDCIVGEFLKGVDLREQHPDKFELLLDDANYRTLFAETLESWWEAGNWKL